MSPLARDLGHSIGGAGMGFIVAVVVDSTRGLDPAAATVAGVGTILIGVVLFVGYGGHREAGDT